MIKLLLSTAVFIRSDRNAHRIRIDGIVDNNQRLVSRECVRVECVNTGVNAGIAVVAKAVVEVAVEAGVQDGVEAGGKNLIKSG